MLRLREIKRHEMDRRFTKKEDNMALVLYKLGPKAYRWLCKMFVLPAPITMSRMISRAVLKPGLNKNIIHQLKKRAIKIKSAHKCVLLFDVIALSPHFDYHRKSDEIIGFENDALKESKLRIIP